MKEKRIAFYHCHTPLHIGSGEMLDVIDLPIQREIHTGFPVMPSTTIKGVIRAEYGLKFGFNAESFPEKPEDCVKKNINESIREEFFGLFGHEDKEGDVIFTDGKVLLFPVKSVKGIFAWITCPIVLERFSRDTNKNLENIPDIKGNKAVAGKDITINSKGDKYLVLEEISFNVITSDNRGYNDSILDTIHNNLPEKLKKEINQNKIAVVSNDMFEYFIKNYTEVNARIKINQATGTVEKEKRALWYEELVPSETVFYNIILSRANNKENLDKIQKFMDNQIFQFGGDETLGRGFTKVYTKEE